MISNQFEYPLPRISIDIEKIVIESNTTKEGFFNIKNIGGGELEGFISSNEKCVKFIPEKFKTNNIKMVYNVDVSMYSKGELIQSSIIISSNGGELVIPFVIKIVAEAIEIKEGTKINSLKEFLSYSKKYPIDSRRILGTTDFLLWLKRIGFEHMDMLEHIIKDSNKERALDNFFTLCKLKKKAFITAFENNSELEIKPYFKEPILGNISILRNGWGYIDTEVIVEKSLLWFKLDTEKITSKSFDINGVGVIKYTINPALIGGKYSRQTIIIKGDKPLNINVNVSLLPFIKLKLSKERFYFNDEGILKIENNSGRDLIFEIFASDNFIKFEARNYPVFESAEIPFSVKFTAIQMAQINLTKKPYIQSEITIRVIINNEVIKKTKNIIIGYSLIDL